MPQTRIALNDYAILIERGEDAATAVFIEGPDAGEAERIGQRFAELLRTPDGADLLSWATMDGLSELRDQAVGTLCELLGVPPKADV
jgi:hypothetical protein